MCAIASISAVISSKALRKISERYRGAVFSPRFCSAVGSGNCSIAVCISGNGNFGKLLIRRLDH
jgi:hypothetical protein